MYPWFFMHTTIILGGLVGGCQVVLSWNGLSANSTKLDGATSFQIKIFISRTIPVLQINSTPHFSNLLQIDLFNHFCIESKLRKNTFCALPCWKLTNLRIFHFTISLLQINSTTHFSYKTLNFLVNTLPQLQFANVMQICSSISTPVPAKSWGSDWNGIAGPLCQI